MQNVRATDTSFYTDNNNNGRIAKKERGREGHNDYTSATDKKLRKTDKKY